MFNLVNIEQAREHLKVDEANATDAVIQEIIGRASSAVLTYIRAPRSAANAQDVWKEDSVPSDIQQATLYVIGDFYANCESGNAAPFSDAVTDLLSTYKPLVWA